jgi:hypothetical protein
MENLVEITNNARVGGIWLMENVYLLLVINLVNANSVFVNVLRDFIIILKLKNVNKIVTHLVLLVLMENVIALKDKIIIMKLKNVKIIAIHLVSNVIMDNANVQMDSNTIQIQRNAIISVIHLALVVAIINAYVQKDKPII